MFYLPKRLFVTLKRLVYIVNNEIAFTLNLRLLFTPIYGDYTKVGRIIGFFFRIGEILVGIVLIIVLGFLAVLTPLLWMLSPFIILFWQGIWNLVVFVAFTFGFWLLTQNNTSEKRTYQVKAPSALAPFTSKDTDSFLKSFRPKTLHFVEVILSNLSGVSKDPQIFYLLKKLELLETDLLTGLSLVKLFKNQVLETAFETAKNLNTRYVEKEHVFLAVIKNIPDTDKFLSLYNTNMDFIEDTVKWVVNERETLSKAHFWQEDYEMPVMGGIGKSMTGRVTPNLNTISQDFTQMAKHGYLNRIVGRHQEIKEIADILGGEKVNILIIGEPGSGKTSIVKGIAQKIVTGTEYKALKFKRIVSLDPGALVAGANSSGALADRLKVVMEEVVSSGDIVLFIDEIQNLLVSENNRNGDVLSTPFAVLEPYLSSNKIQFIGATNIENYRKYIEPNGSFSRLFDVIEIPEASKADTLEILKVVARKFEKQYQIIITYPALRKVIDLCDKLIHERVMPDKAIDILNRTAAEISNSTKYLTAEDIAKEISQVTKIPVSAISEDESKKLLNIEDDLMKRVIGQNPAINQIGSALKRARAGIRNESKPIAGFLFVGTTGIGKTETAKALAQTYFGDIKSMIRLDMSEYQQVDSLSRLIGDPIKLSKGILTEAVRSKPFALILLDELEKAHPNILMIFLQVLDDGRLTDSVGKVIDFTNTIIIATSNVGTRKIQEVSERNGTFDEMRDAAMGEVRDKYAPEFLNRFSGIIVFKPLDMFSVKKIAELMLAKIKKLAEEKGINISFKPELIDELIKRGFDQKQGARPLARVIENSVESYLAVNILSNKFTRGSVVDLGTEVFDNSSIY